MPWHKTGTVAVTANSATVTGTGTAFDKNTRIGDAFLGPDGRWYEITGAPGATTLSIDPAYKGATANGQAYAIVPVQGYNAYSAALLREITQTLSAFANNVNLNALAQAVGAANKGVYFTGPGAMATFDLAAQGRTFLAATTQATQRTALGLGTASVLNASAFAQNFLNAATQVAQQESLNLIKSANSYRTSLSAPGMEPGSERVASIYTARGMFMTTTGSASTDNWNDQIEPGVADNLMINSSVNSPGIGTYAYAINIRHSVVLASGNGVQMAIGYPISGSLAQAPRLALRGKYGNDWTPWVEYWNNRDLFKQNSLTDSTPGAVLLNGGHGVGGEAITVASSADADAIPVTRFFKSTSAPNSQFAISGVGINLTYSATSAVQLYSGVLADQLMMRRKAAGVWQAPVSIWHTGNLVPNRLETRTQATLPSAAANVGQMFLCTDTARGYRAVMPITSTSGWRYLEDTLPITSA